MVKANHIVCPGPVIHATEIYLPTAGPTPSLSLKVAKTSHPLDVWLDAKLGWPCIMHQTQEKCQHSSPTCRPWGTELSQDHHLPPGERQYGKCS